MLSTPESDGVKSLAEHLSRAALESLPCVFYLFTAEGRLLRWNRELEAVTGYRPDEIASMHPLQFFPQHEHELVAASIARVLERGEHVVEASLLSRSGEATSYFFSARRLVHQGEQCVIGTGIDVSERRQAMEALRQSEQRLRTIIEQSPISIAIVSMDGTIEYINRRAVETFGYTHDEIPTMERWWAQAYPDESYRSQVVAQWMGLVEVAIATGRDIERREYEVTCKDGTVKSAVIFGVFLDGKVFAMFEDVTARKLAEQARLRAEQHLHLAQRIEALGRLSGGIAHDFNNILMGLLGNAELLTRRLSPDDERRALAESLLQSSYRARDLVRQILAFARREVIEKHPASLGGIVAEALRLLQASLPANIEVRLVLDPRETAALVDRSQVQQVVTNLATNAADAIGPDGGRIELRVAPVDITESDCAAHPELTVGRFVRLSVSDTGCGMTKETLAHAFEPFFTTKPVGQGTGLGLAVVYGIMAHHGGAVLAQSAAGRGTVVEAYFPAHQGAATAAQPREQHPAPRDAALLSVLLVDDDSAVLKVTRCVLEERGFRVAAFTDARAAIEYARDLAQRIDIAVIDLAMPIMYGDELARRLYELRPGLPLLLVSGNVGQVDPARLRVANIGGVVEKPFDMAALYRAIDRCLGRT